MAISTRSQAIAKEEGCPLKFDSVDPRERASVEIFMPHACADGTGWVSFGKIDELKPSLSKIPSICDRLPIALLVIGQALAKDVRRVKSFERALDG